MIQLNLLGQMLHHEPSCSLQLDRNQLTELTGPRAVAQAAASGSVRNTPSVQVAPVKGQMH